MYIEQLQYKFKQEREVNMSGKFMKVYKHVIPTLTMIIIASQLMGCAVASPKEIQEMTEIAQEIEIEIAVPISVELGEQQSIDWIRLDQLNTYEDFRRELEDIMKITRFGENSKNGICYINLDGQQEGNNTLYNALMNRKFIANFLENDTAKLELSVAIKGLYADIEDDDNMVAAINAYWNLLPDAEPNYFNPDQTLNRLEAMSLIARANHQVTDEFGDEAFTDAVGQSEYTDYASLVADDSYLSIGTKSLNPTTAVGTITRGEYIYMLINNIFGSDRMSRANIQKVQFNDCKNGGDIASQQNYKNETSVNDYYESDELNYAIKNPDKGCPERMYRALVTAQELNIIGSETRWDEGLTKAEAIQLYIETIQAYTRENGYPVDAVNGLTQEDILNDMELIEEDLLEDMKEVDTTFGGSATSENLGEAEAPEEEQQPEQKPKQQTEQKPIEQQQPQPSQDQEIQDALDDLFGNSNFEGYGDGLIIP